MRLKTIVGKEVLDEKGSILGKVSDIDIDTASNCVNNFIITPKSGNSITNTFSRKNEILVPFEMIKSIGDKIILKKAITEAESIVEELEMITY